MFTDNIDIFIIKDRSALPEFDIGPEKTLVLGKPIPFVLNVGIDIGGRSHIQDANTFRSRVIEHNIILILLLPNFIKYYCTFICVFII